MMDGRVCREILEKASAIVDKIVEHYLNMESLKMNNGSEEQIKEEKHIIETYLKECNDMLGESDELVAYKEACQK